MLIQSIVTGILLGGLYAIVGLGMSIVFGIMKLTNIAHGNLMMMAAFIIMVMTTSYIPNVILALIITVVIMVGVGFLFQTTLVNKVIDKGDEPALLVTFGLSIVIQNILDVIFGADARSIKTPFATVNVIDTELVSISGAYLTNFIVAVVVILVLSAIIKNTYLGRAIRATSDNKKAAELMGVNTKKFFAITMAIAMATAAIAGLLVGNTFVFYPHSGTTYLIIAFGVVVIGGMGSIGGTLIGGICFGLAQLLGSYFFGTGFQLLTGYVFMLVVLATRPNGLFAKAARK